MSDILNNFFFTWLDPEPKIEPVFLSQESMDQMIEAMKQRLDRENSDLQYMEDRQWCDIKEDSQEEILQTIQEEQDREYADLQYMEDQMMKHE